jgi:hypothetical protein
MNLISGTHHSCVRKEYTIICTMILLIHLLNNLLDIMHNLINFYDDSTLHFIEC